MSLQLETAFNEIEFLILENWCNMIASQTTHSPQCENEEALTLFLDLSKKQAASSRHFSSGSRRAGDKKKLVSPSVEISWIEGTVSVAF